MRKSIRGCVFVLSIAATTVFGVAAEAVQYTACGLYVGEDSPGEGATFIGPTKTANDVKAIMRDVAKGAVAINKNMAEAHSTALRNFAGNIEAPTSASGKLDSGRVFGKVLIDEIQKAVTSTVTQAASQMPGGQALILFKYHQALEKATQTARSNLAARGVVEVVTTLSKDYAALAASPSDTDIVVGLGRKMSAEVGDLGERPTEEQAFWVTKLCADYLEHAAAVAKVLPQDVEDPTRIDEESMKQLIDYLEVELYEAWINARYAEWKDWKRRDETVNPTLFDDAVPPSIEVRFEASQEDGLRQKSGTVNDPAKGLGGSIAERLDQLPVKPWYLDAPIRVCLDASGFPGPKCGLFESRDGTRYKVDEPVSYPLALRFLSMDGWRDDMTCIDPHREPRGICWPGSWHGE